MSLPSARFSCRSLPSQDTGAERRTVPGHVLRHRRQGVWPPGQSASFVPPGFPSVLSKRRCQICLPLRDVCEKEMSETPVSTASSREPCGVVTRSATSEKKQSVHFAWCAFELDLPLELDPVDVRLGEYLLVADPSGARPINALGKDVGRGPDTICQQQEERGYLGNSHCVVCPFVAES